MDSWTTLVFFFFVSLLCLALTSLLNKSTKSTKLPPGPPSIPILGSLIFLTKGMTGLAEASRELRARYGSIVTLYAGSHPFVLITDGELAHKLLVQEQAVAFSDRPLADQTEKISSANQHTINKARYGPLWRVLRRNIVSEVLHPSRIKIYSSGREWAIRLLVDELRSQAAASGNGVVTPVMSFEFSFFGLLSFVCFGEKLDEKILRSIQQNVWDFHSIVNEDLDPFKFLTKLANFALRNKWNKMLELHQRMIDNFEPLIQARRERKRSGENQNFAYVDSLVDLRLSDDRGRKLTQDELVALCLEVYVGGIDTTTVSLQWTMANLVKNPKIQEKLVEDIKGVVGSEESEWVSEEDAQKSPYLKAVIKESLRLYPPGHFVLPHRVSDDVQVDKYVIPKGTTVNVAVGVISRDEKLWENAMEFKPERFMPGGEGEGVDVTGSKEIRMMPFGVGRRICPGLVLATLHLEYFVANLVWKFEWKTAMEGEEVDMTEETAFTTSMKNPLKARLVPRRRM